MTLIEALVAVALTVMLGALGFAEADAALARLRLSQATAMVSSDLRLARGNAQRHGRASFAASPDGRYYSAGSGRFVALPPGSRLHLSDGRPVQFFADGSSTGGSVVVQNDRGHVVLLIESATGLIHRDAR